MQISDLKQSPTTFEEPSRGPKGGSSCHEFSERTADVEGISYLSMLRQDPGMLQIKSATSPPAAPSRHESQDQIEETVNVTNDEPQDRLAVKLVPPLECRSHSTEEQINVSSAPDVNSRKHFPFSSIDKIAKISMSSEHTEKEKADESVKSIEEIIDGRKQQTLNTSVAEKQLCILNNDSNESSKDWLQQLCKWTCKLFERSFS